MTNSKHRATITQHVYQAYDLDSWLQDAEKALRSAQKERVGADPVVIEKQIAALKALGDEAVLHLKDLEKTKVAGRDVVDAKPELQSNVNKITGELLVLSSSGLIGSIFPKKIFIYHCSMITM